MKSRQRKKRTKWTRAGLSIEPPSLDGTGNNLENEDWGSAGTQLLRLTSVEYADDISEPTGEDRPGAREVSNALVAQSESIPNDRGAPRPVPDEPRIAIGLAVSEVPAANELATAGVSMMRPWPLIQATLAQSVRSLTQRCRLRQATNNRGGLPRTKEAAKGGARSATENSRLVILRSRSWARASWCRARLRSDDVTASPLPSMRRPALMLACTEPTS